MRLISLVALAAGCIVVTVVWLLAPRDQPPPARQGATVARNGAVPRPASQAGLPVVAPREAAPAVGQPIAPTDAPAGGPRFDIARVAPDGNAVIAGRAAPGAQVTILDGERPIGQAQADSRGAFVFLPSTPMAPGPRELRLTERTPEGNQTAGNEQVVLVVPPRDGAGAAPPAMALLTAPNTAPRLLQAPPPTGRTDPGPAAPGDAGRPAGAMAPRPLGLDVVDYDAAGDIRFSGSAPAGAALRVYVDNQPLGEATADSSGRWSFQAPGRVTAGEHQLRLDQLATTGRVAARVELPFRREAAPSALASVRPVAPGGQIVVQPGDSLWLLARHSYGEGTRYTAIHVANRGQIKNPHLIYPGQVLAVPAVASPQAAGAATGSSTAASSSRSR